MKNIKLIAALVFILCSLTFLTSCNDKNEKKKDEIKSYKVLTVSKRSIVLKTDYPTTLQGRQNVEIRPKIDGYIDAIYVDEGARVRKGQLLFKISNPQYEEAVRNAQAAIGVAEAAVETSRLEVEKTKPLVEKQIVSKYELESAILNLKSKEAALIQAKATLANAKANLAYSRITSPVDGVIGLIPYKIGALVSSSLSEPLTTVSDIEVIYAYFSFNEKQLLAMNGNKKKSGKTEVELILPDGTAYPQNGKIDMISGQIDTNTGSATARASFTNPDRILRSGGSAVLRIPQSFDSVLVIPQSATTELQNVRFAYVLSKGNKVKSMHIKTIASSDGQFFIVTDGLRTGEKIILEGVHLLKDDQEIIPVDTIPENIYNPVQ